MTFSRVHVSLFTGARKTENPAVENLDKFVIDKKQGTIHPISRNAAHFLENWFLSLPAKRAEKTIIYIVFLEIG